MPFEWLVGQRYLMAARRQGAPSIITLMSVGSVAIGVAALILVLGILGGFEGDLRTKILGTKAHILVTGPDHGVVEDYAPVLAAIEATPGVAGAAAFVESDVMMSSATNYAGVVIRGVDPEALRRTSQIDDYMREGELGWISDSEQALRYRRERLGDDDDLSVEQLRDLADSLRRDLDALQQEMGSGAELDPGAVVPRLDGSGDGSGGRVPVPAGAVVDDAGATAGGAPDGSAADGAVPADGSAAGTKPSDVGAAAGDGSGVANPGGEAVAEAVADGTAEVAAAAAAAEGSGDGSAAPPRSGPRTLAERLAERDRRDQGQPERTAAALPGVVIGTELADSLHVGVGDQVQVINPDGDLGPTGPIPRAWQYRVVGIFYTGLYEYDNTVVYMAPDAARRFLNVDPAEATGVEVRVEQVDAAATVAMALQAALAGQPVEVRTWMELNSSLFAALQLEQIVIGLLLMIIVLVASFAIVCVLIMIVIQRGDEIAVMRSMGASARSIQRVFIVQGMTIGVAGTATGLALGLGAVAYLVFIGFPLDANVYYIDRVPVELARGQVVAVALGALGISAAATLLPSIQAARLDPAAALRHD